jgi:DNA-binding response OmpR family regulator
MVAVILVAQEIVAEDLESLLKPAGWAPRQLSSEDGDGGLDAHLRALLGTSGDGSPVPNTVLIAPMDLQDADGAVEQILAQCSRIRIVLVTPDSIDREHRRAISRALRAGADDFVTLSSLSTELTLRLSVGRGGARRRELGRLQRICDLQLERGARRLRHGAKIVSLTPCEYRVFACLASRPGHVVSRASIQRRLARRSRSVSRNMVDVYVLYLRRKLAALECRCSIRTIRGVGYALAEEQSMSAPVYDATSALFEITHLDG